MVQNIGTVLLWHAELSKGTEKRTEIHSCVCRGVPVSCQPTDDDDVDVACERRRVLRGDADNDMLKINNLTKV